MHEGIIEQEEIGIERIISSIRNNEPDRAELVKKLRGVDFSGMDLSGLDLSGADMSMSNLEHADLSGAKLDNANLMKANLKGAILYRTSLRNAELTGADLSGANLEEADATSAGMGMTKLDKAIFFNANLEWASLTKANAFMADFRCTNLRNARIREADVSGSDFTNADCHSCDLSLTNVEKATFNNANLQNARLRLVKNFETASWIGVDIRNINFAGAYRLRREIADQNYLKEFKESGKISKVIYFFWWLTSDCGRSMARWCFWIVAQAVFFAWLFTMVGVDYGQYKTWLSPLYYSIVTLTTLGYGDVVPASLGAQVVAIAEVVTGYVMLGGLISILSTKMTRRAD